MVDFDSHVHDFRNPNILQKVANFPNFNIWRHPYNYLLSAGERTLALKVWILQSEYYHTVLKHVKRE